MRSIVTDNFFDDPYKIIEFANQQTYYPRSEVQYYEGVRTKNMAEVDINFYEQVVQKMVFNYYDINQQYKIDGYLVFHKLSEKDLADPNWLNCKEHTDKCILSNIVYLSPNAPMSSGTQLYQKIDEKYVPDVIYSNMFNRIIQFPGNVFHSAMDFRGGPEDRLTLLFFLEQIEVI